ncbi:MAG TPA: DNA-binding response regulator, partial [Lachnospiraceae bacterium]|nr:DNA-binding response regulator [Lachnospiraceae bacterium]
MTKLKHYNILIAEDEALLRQSLANSINSLDSGFKVIHQVSNGEEALRYLKTNTIHLLITDIRMPAMDGLALAKCVHEQYPHIFTVVLT